MDNYSLTSLPILPDDNTIRKEINISMLIRYILFPFTILFLCHARKNLPYPPQLTFVLSIFLLLFIILHLLSLNKKLLIKIYFILPFIDFLISPLTIHYTGGFISPFILINVLTGICSLIMSTSSKYISRYVNILILVNYIIVSILQKQGILYNPVEYSRELMKNSTFFYFVVTVTSFVIILGSLYVEKINSHIHNLLQDLTRSFDSIVKGTTGVVSEDFFVNLARYGVASFGIKCLYIAKIKENKKNLETLVIWIDNKIEKNYSISLENAFVNEILKNPNQRIYSIEALKNYRDDPLTSLFEINFIFGLPLKNSKGKIIGVMMILHDEIPQNLYLIYSLLSIFASRAAAEIERKNAEEEKIQIEHQLAHSQKIEALGQITSSIVHDFNNIITAIGGYAQLLKKRLGVENPLVEMVEHIIKATNNASNLTNQLTLFAKKEAISETIVNVHTVIDFTISLLRQVTSKNPNIKILKQLNATEFFTIGNESMLQNVLLNLGINARDACENKEEGIISYSTESVYLDKEDMLCKSFSIQEGKYIEIEVKDNGCGIKKEIIDRIFEPFFSTKPKEKGTGLGLANVWRYIETFKGAITVESEEGVGSTFSLYLPVITQNIPIEEKKESQKESVFEPFTRNENFPSEHRKKFILIADDEESFRNIYSTILSENGYRVHTCKDGVEAVTFVKENNFPIDLIILDVIMPNLNGPKAMEEIRKYRPDVKILFTSGFANENILQPHLSSPNTAFLLKPIEEEKLLNFISTFLTQ